MITEARRHVTMENLVDEIVIATGTVLYVAEMPERSIPLPFINLDYVIVISGVCRYRTVRDVIRNNRDEKTCNDGEPCVRDSDCYR